MRKFYEVSDKSKKFKDVTTVMPRRGTTKSSGYDFHSKETKTLKVGESYKFTTDVKAQMQDDEWLMLMVRSSGGIKKGLRLKNQVGNIDSDYFNNPSNEGNIIVCLQNAGLTDVTIEAGDKIAQGVFQRYLITDDDCPESEKREGGVGSTGN